MNKYVIFLNKVIKMLDFASSYSSSLTLVIKMAESENVAERWLTFDGNTAIRTLLMAWMQSTYVCFTALFINIAQLYFLGHDLIVITVAGFTGQIQPSWRRAGWIHGVDQVPGTTFAGWYPCINCRCLSLTYSLEITNSTKNNPVEYPSAINFVELMQLTACK